MKTEFEILKRKLAYHEYPSGYFSALCPFHEDKNPSMLVSPEGYNCLACGAHGSIRALYAHVFNVNVDRVGVDKGVEPFADIHNDWRLGIELIKRGFGVSYLRSRGLTIDTIYTLQLGYVKPKLCYSIPIFYSDLVDKSGDFHGVIYRSASKEFQRQNLVEISWKYKTLTAAQLYFPKPVSSYAENVIITFGIFDAIILWQMGYIAGSTLFGKRMGEHALEYLDNLHIPVYIIPDKGEEEDAYKITRKMGLRWRTIELDYPRRMKDVNDLYRANYISLLEQVAKYVGNPQPVIWA